MAPDLFSSLPLFKILLVSVSISAPTITSLNLLISANSFITATISELSL